MRYGGEQAVKLFPPGHCRGSTGFFEYHSSVNEVLVSEALLLTGSAKETLVQVDE